MNPFGLHVAQALLLGRIELASGAAERVLRDVFLRAAAMAGVVRASFLDGATPRL